MLALIKYEIMIILTDEFNDNELKTWAFNYAKSLRKVNATDISVISRGKRDLAYLIEGRKKGNYIQLNFSTTSKLIEKFANNLMSDPNVIRFLVINKK